jgi:DNA-binding PadR family transcriptional regulator
MSRRRRPHDWAPWWAEFAGSETTGPRPAFFRSGEVRLALLSLLSERPAHGYELMRQLEERSGRLYRASAGTVYPVLQQLQDEGMVSVDDQDGKKVYSLTDAGRAEVADHADEIEAIWSRAERWQEWGRNVTPHTIALGVTVGRLVGAAFRAVREDPELGDRVREILEEAEDEIRAARRESGA